MNILNNDKPNYPPIVDGNHILNLKDFLDTKHSRYDVIRNCIKIVRIFQKEQHFLKEPINKLALRISNYVLKNFDDPDHFFTYYYHNSDTSNIQLKKEKEEEMMEIMEMMENEDENEKE